MRGCEAKQSREASPGRLDGSKASALTGFVASHRAEAVAHILICQDIGLNGRRHLLHVLEAAKDAWMCASQSPCGNTRNGCVTRQPQLYATILSPSPPPLAPTFLPASLSPCAHLHSYLPARPLSHLSATSSALPWLYRSVKRAPGTLMCTAGTPSFLDVTSCSSPGWACPATRQSIPGNL